MLWKKESRKMDALYTDLFAVGQNLLMDILNQNGSRLGTQSSTITKNDALSLQNRQQGNQEFGKGNWNEAIEYYNASLRYAENGSKNIALAYANRASCYLKMKRYNECLIDIELATDSGYPADLMHKLHQRKEECLQGIQQGLQSVRSEPKLSFKPNEQYPCMANVLKFGQDAEGKWGLFAEKDIAVGQTIIMEKAFIAFLASWYGTKCYICLKEHVNLFPCKECTVAMFCSEECQRSTLHDHECGIRFSEDNDLNGVILRTVRSCLLAIEIFPNIDELMSLVEQAVKSDRNQAPANELSAKSQYEMFLKLPIRSDTSMDGGNLFIASSAYKILSSIPKLKSVFKEEKYRRCLMHLTLHHYLVLDLNSNTAHTIVPAQGISRYGPWISSMVGLIVDYVKYSCAPNILISSFNGNMTVTAIRPIKKGHELLETALDTVAQPKSKRQQSLWQARKMVCKCERCTDVTASLAQRKRMISDPDYRYLASNPFSAMNKDDDEAMRALINKCEQFLQKYGHPWSDEIANILLMYIMLINARFRGYSKLINDP